MLNLLGSEAIESVGVNVGINVLASLIWAPLSFLIVFLWTKMRNSLFKRMMYKNTRLNLSDRTQGLEIDCFYANSNKVDKGEATALGYPFEYMAAATVQSYLNLLVRKNFRMDIYPSPVALKDALVEKSDDLLLLGGPFHNSFTRLFFGLIKGQTNLPFYFDSIDGEDATLVLTDEVGGGTFTPKKDVTGKYYADDYGLIINVKNVYDNNKRRIAIMGCRSIGVLGAAMAFTELSKTIYEKTKEYDEYAVVVSCHGNQYNVSKTPEICKCIELSSIKKEDLFVEKKQNKSAT